jgi:hypothetical protein
MTAILDNQVYLKKLLYKNCHRFKCEKKNATDITIYLIDNVHNFKTLRSALAFRTLTDKNCSCPTKSVL